MPCKNKHRSYTMKGRVEDQFIRPPRLREGCETTEFGLSNGVMVTTFLSELLQ
jgi:hypothetical protein